MVRRHVWWPALLLVVVGPVTAAGPDDWPVPRGPSREPAPYRYDPKVTEGLPRDFLDDAAACVLYAGTSHLVEPDGTIETVTHEVTRLNGRKGVEKVGEYRNLVYTPAYQKLTLNEARVHKPGGRVVAVRPRDVHLRDVGTDYQSYDPDKQLIITFPTLDVGDTVEVKWTVRGKNPEHAGRFFTRYSFGDPTYPVVLDELRVRVPAAGPFASATTGPVKPGYAVSEAVGFRVHRWHQARCPGPSRDDDLPSREELRSAVACSTFPDWAAVGAWKQTLRGPCWECTPAVAEVVKGVTKGLTTPLEKARALTYWVRKNVRYVALGANHDYTPHAPDLVLANRFGDCKDGSQLLAVMLREAGVRVELATLGALDDGQVDPAVPSPWGTHAILLATIDGRPHWIDTTSRLARWDELPRDDRDRLCYLTDDKGQLRLLRTPPPGSADQLWEQTTEVWIGSDGSARCVRETLAHGAAAVTQRDRFLEVPVGERRRQVASELQDAHSRTRLVKLDVDEPALRDYERPAKTRVEFEIPRQWAGSSDLEGSITDSRVWGKLLAHNLDPDRTVPLVLPAAFESTHTYKFHLPPTHVLDDLPRSKVVKSKWGTFEVAAKSLTGKGPVRELEVTFRTKLQQTRVEPADFEAYLQFHEDVNREYRIWVTLKPASDAASVPLLEDYTAFCPQDAVAAKVLAKIHHAAGRPADAVRVLRRARAYRPDDAKLVELALKYADGFASEEEAQRELVRRTPASSDERRRHQLALAATLITRGQHAEARGLLTPLTTTGPAAQRAQAHFQFARSHYRKDELKLALASLEAARREDAEVMGTVRALMLEGQVLEELKRGEAALAAYRLALAGDRENLEVLLSVIRLAIETGQRAEAADALRRYGLLVENDLSGLQLAAEAYLKLGRLDEAFDLASRARELRFHEKTQRILGLVLLRRGEPGPALVHLEKAEADDAVLTALLRAYLEVGNLREATATLDRAGRVDRPSAALTRAVAQAERVKARRAQLTATAGKPSGADGVWGTALDALACAEWAWEANPTAAPALLERALADVKPGPAVALRGRLALERGRVTRARADADEAVALAPADPAGHVLRARVLLERGDGAALPAAEQAAKLTARQDADALLVLAEALGRAGRKAESQAAARDGLKVRPGDLELQALAK